MVLLTEVLTGPNDTLLLMLLADFTREDFADFKMDVGDLVDMLDMVESDDLVVAMVIEFDFGVDVVPQKPEIGARL